MESKIPVVSASENATPNQVEYLKKLGLFKEGLTKEEASALIETSKGNLMPPGLHLMKIKSIEPWTDFQGKPKKDSRGYPGIYITFINKEKQTQSNGFYYDPSPLNAPHRKDEGAKCKSEFNLRSLRSAFGWGSDMVITDQHIKEGKVYGVVAKREYKYPNGDFVVDSEGNRISDNVLIHKYLPANMTHHLEGDPAKNNGVPGGIFYEVSKREDKRDSSPTTESAYSAPAEATEEGSQDDLEF